MTTNKTTNKPNKKKPPFRNISGLNKFFFKGAHYLTSFVSCNKLKSDCQVFSFLRYISSPLPTIMARRALMANSAFSAGFYYINGKSHFSQFLDFWFLITFFYSNLIFYFFYLIFYDSYYWVNHISSPFLTFSSKETRKLNALINALIICDSVSVMF